MKDLEVPASEMSLSGQEKLEKLFTYMPRPPVPSLGTPVLFERDLAEIPQEPIGSVTQETKSRSPGNAAPVAQHARQVTNSDSQTPGARDVLASSDEEDDYVSAFSSKHKVRSSPAKITFFAQGKQPLEKNAQKLRYRGRQSANIETIMSRVTEPRPLISQFCSFWLLSKFPYKYMDDGRDQVSRYFFASNKFYQREWTLYYLNPPVSIGGNPLLLVAFVQASEFIQTISKTFNIELSVPQFPFTMPFYEDGTPQPLLLGTARDRNQVHEMNANIPEAEPNFGECPPSASAVDKNSFMAWHEKFLQAREGGSKTRKRQKNSSHQKGNVIVVEQCEQLKRAERYFGLRPKISAPSAQPEGLTWDEEEQFKQGQLRSRGLVIDFLDIEKPAPYHSDHSPVIICIDVESWEMNHSLITEVGVSTLDTLDIVDIPPGKEGKNWLDHIRSRHFRITGTAHIQNTKWCIGYPDKFQFGTTEWVSLSDAPSMVDSCFEWPFSVQFKHNGAAQPKDLASELSDMTLAQQPCAELREPAESVQKGPRDRNIVFLGHDTGTDITYLGKLGSEIFGKPTTADSSMSDPDRKSRRHILGKILESLDTAIIDQTMRKDSQIRSLQAVCADVGVACWFPHNGGNDARYTLEALVKLIVKARLAEDDAARATSPESKSHVIPEWEAENERRVQEKIDKAIADVQAELRAWEAAKAAKAAGTTIPEPFRSKAQSAPSNSEPAAKETETKEVYDRPIRTQDAYRRDTITTPSMVAEFSTIGQSPRHDNKTYLPDPLNSTDLPQDMFLSDDSPAKKRRHPTKTTKQEGQEEWHDPQNSDSASPNPGFHSLVSQAHASQDRKKNKRASNDPTQEIPQPQGERKEVTDDGNESEPPY